MGTRHRRGPGWLRRATAATAATLVTMVALRPAAVAATFTNNFDAYPAGARSCLYQAADASSCDGDTAAEMNECLCDNGGNFVLAAAACIGLSDAADVESVYSTMASACAYSDTPLSVSQKDFVLAANQATSSSTSATSTSTTSTTSTTRTTSTTSTTTGRTTTTTKPTSTTTSSSSSSSAGTTTVTTIVNGHTTTVTSTSAGATNTGGGGNNNGDDSGDSGSLSRGARIGIIAGAAAGGVALLAGLAFVLYRVRQRRRPAGEEHRPMLVPGNDGFGLEGPLAGTEWKAAGASGQSSPYPYPAAAGAAAASSASPVYYQNLSTPLPPHGGVYEMAATEAPQAPAEMPATPLFSTVDTAYRPPHGYPPQGPGPTGYR